jgi:hypothetical protein
MTANGDLITCLTVNPTLGCKQGHVLRRKMIINEILQECQSYKEKLLVHKCNFVNLNKYFVGIDWQSELGRYSIDECQRDKNADKEAEQSLESKQKM